MAEQLKDDTRADQMRQAVNEQDSETAAKLFYQEALRQVLQRIGTPTLMTAIERTIKQESDNQEHGELKPVEALSLPDMQALYSHLLSSFADYKPLDRRETSTFERLTSKAQQTSNQINLARQAWDAFAAVIF